MRQRFLGVYEDVNVFDNKMFYNPGCKFMFLYEREQMTVEKFLNLKAPLNLVKNFLS